MPKYVVNKVAEALNAHGRSVMGSRILIVGLAYKANVDDDRESASFKLMKKLKERGADLAYYDPYISVIGQKREYKEWSGIRSVKWNQDIAAFDIAVISTAHDVVNNQELADWVPLIIDTRNVMYGIKTKIGQLWKA